MRPIKKPLDDLESNHEKILNVRFYTDYDRCNYSCPYCIAADSRSPADSKRWDSETFFKIIGNLIRLPYRLNVRLGVGGEFFLSDELIKGGRILSHANNVTSLNLITNLSFSAERYQKFLNGFDHKKVAVVASYHPTEIKRRRQWLEAAHFMHATFDFSIVLVAYPPLIGGLSANIDFLRAEGFDVFAQGYIGSYNQRSYPSGYTDRERGVLRRLFYSRHDYEFFVESKKPGLCNAGYRSFFVGMDGQARSCGMGGRSPVLGGLLQAPRLELFNGPRPCLYENCLCDTENMNTVIFQQHYCLSGLNQHKYSYRFEKLAAEYGELNEWNIGY